MPSYLKLYPLGNKGLDIDSDPLTIEDAELRLAQNVSRNALDGGLRKRPGLTASNANLAGGPILGGIGVPTINLNATTGTILIYIGRGPS